MTMEKYYKQEIKPEQYKIGEGIVKHADEKDPEMWRTPPGGGVGSSPLIFGDLVIFGSHDTYLYALDKNSGKVVWKFKTGDVVVSAPGAENNVVVFGSKDGYVYALDAQTGKMLWKYLASGMVDTKAVFYNGNVYIGNSKGFMHCFSPSGDLLWKYKTGSSINSSPAFVNEKLYFGSCDKNFYCLNTGGEVVWKYYAGDWVDMSPAIFANREEIWSFAGKKRDYEGPASVCFGSYTKNFYVLDCESGALRWMRRMDGIVTWGHPTVKDGRIYFGDWAGYLYCLDAEKGAMNWKVLSGGNIDAQPLVHENYIYFVSLDGNLYALSLEGKISWKYLTGWLVFSKPAVANNILYFGSMDTNFYAIDINTRKVVWKFVTGGGVPAKLPWIKIIEQIKESQRIFSAWKPELIKPAYKEDKNLTFIAAPSEHAYAMKEPYKTESPYQMQQKKKKMPWER